MCFLREFVFVLSGAFVTFLIAVTEYLRQAKMKGFIFGSHLESTMHHGGEGMTLEAVGFLASRARKRKLTAPWKYCSS